MSATLPAARKCVVWDLDGTLWTGVLAEGVVQPRVEALALLDLLDRRGILQSIASRTEESQAMAKLVEFGIAEYFVVPQFGWGPKSESISRIARELNLSTNSFALIDDQEVEREEVRSSLPKVLCLDAADLKLANLPEFRASFGTQENYTRRRTYLAEANRRRDEEAFHGLPVEFERTLDLHLEVRTADPGDIERIRELTERTHQLNSTGKMFSSEELQALCASPDHLVLIASLEDRYGSYGRIGLAVIRRESDAWTLLLVLVSCRVISRGAGTLLLGTIMRAARQHGVSLRAEFIPTEFNRITYIMLKMAGFEVASRLGNHQLLALPEGTNWTAPTHVRLSTSSGGWGMARCQAAFSF